MHPSASEHRFADGQRRKVHFGGPTVSADRQTSQCLVVLVKEEVVVTMAAVVTANKIN